MDFSRMHGKPPFRVVVVHGGPGGGGEMAPVARELSCRWGVVEPIQTAVTIEGQVEELTWMIEEHTRPPVALVGWSWGAWLSCFLAAGHPGIVERLVLVASSPFEEKYTARILAARVSRLNGEERAEFEALLRKLDDPAAAAAAAERDASLARLGALAAKADSFDPIPWEGRERDEVPSDGSLFQAVWRAAAGLRRSGELLRAAGRIRCPVVAIHGDRDPHPAEGVQEPLSRVLPHFRFVLLERCGHTPWLERQARAAFFEALEGALGEAR